MLTERSLLVVCVLLAACSGAEAPGPGPDPNAIALVAVAPTARTVQSIGDTARFSATARTSSGATVGATVSWQPANSSVVTVDGTGQVTAVSNGSTFVIATAGGKRDSAAVTVTQTAGRSGVS